MFSCTRIDSLHITTVKALLKALGGLFNISVKRGGLSRKGSLIFKIAYFRRNLQTTVKLYLRQ